MNLWAIAYTLDNKRRPRKDPNILVDTIRSTRGDAWDAWYGPGGGGAARYALDQMRERWGAKAIKIRVEVR